MNSRSSWAKGTGMVITNIARWKYFNRKRVEDGVFVCQQGKQVTIQLATKIFNRNDVVWHLVKHSGYFQLFWRNPECFHGDNLPSPCLASFFWLLLLLRSNKQSAVMAANPHYLLFKHILFLYRVSHQRIIPRLWSNAALWRLNFVLRMYSGS